MALPNELVSQVLKAVEDHRDLLMCRTVCRVLGQIASGEEIWRPRARAAVGVAHGVAYAAHVAALLDDVDVPAYQCFWIAGRLARAPPEAQIHTEFHTRRILGSREAIRSHHLSPLLRALFGEEAIKEADTLDVVEELDPDGMGWVRCDDFLQWLVTDTCWLLDQDQPDSDSPGAKSLRWPPITIR